MKVSGKRPERTFERMPTLAEKALLGLSVTLSADELGTSRYKDAPMQGARPSKRRQCGCRRESEERADREEMGTAATRTSKKNKPVRSHRAPGRLCWWGEGPGGTVGRSRAAAAPPNKGNEVGYKKGTFHSRLLSKLVWEKTLSA